MKNQYKKILLLSTLLFTISCVLDTAFEIPNTSITEPNIEVNSSILKVKTALQQEFNSKNKVIYTFPIHQSSPTYIEGFVVSSDATGNFYKKIILQNKSENPTAGIEILLNKPSLNTSYDIGRKLYIKLDGLSVSYDDGASTIDPTNLTIGKYVLGFLDGNSVQNIPSTAIKEHIIRSSTVKEVIPTIIDLSTVTESHINTFIQLENAQFEKTQLQKSFSGEPNDEFDGFRYVFDCKTEQTIRLQTSTFSSFKSVIIPADKGSIDAVLTKDYSSEFLVTIINSPSDISFIDTDRCDPVFLDCGIATGGNATILLNEDFENIKNNSALLAAGWSNINANGNSTLFKTRSSGGNRLMEMSAYNSGENPLEVWLVSPTINLDATTNEKLSFETNTGYDNGKVMTVYVSSNFTGDVKTATWVQLDTALSEGPSSGYGSSFTKSGVVNIACLTGDFHLAFKYIGADGGVTTTFQIDNVKITGE
jgi:hypothetical protein